MLSIGGVDYNKTFNMAINPNNNIQDNFTQGLGIFDLTEMAWASGYNASAAAYTTPQVVKDQIASSGNQPSAWNSTGSQQIFATSRASSLNTTTATPSHSSTASPPAPTKTSHTPVGAIEGGVIGGVVSVLVIAGLVMVSAASEKVADGRPCRNGRLRCRAPETKRTYGVAVVKRIADRGERRGLGIAHPRAAAGAWRADEGMTGIY